MFGLITLQDLETIWTITWNSTFTFVAIIIFSLVLEEAGFFRFLGFRIAQNSRSSRKVLFIYISFFTALVSALFANDGAILVMTPVTFLLLRELGFDPREMIPYLISVAFISDIASTPFVISNLVNIIAASYFSLDFITYAEVMFIPNLVAVLTSIAILYLIFRKELSGTFALNHKFDGSSMIQDNLIFNLAAPMTIALMITYALTGLYGIPVAFVAVPSISAFFAIASLRGKVDSRKILREAPWQVVLFSLGMFIVVFALGNSGLTSFMASSLSWIGDHTGVFSITVSGLFIVPFTSFLNNLPATMLTGLAVHSLGSSGGMIYELIIANDIGTKISPIGSLATLLWLHDLSVKRNIRIPAAEYVKYGVLVTIPALILSSLALTVFVY